MLEIRRCRTEEIDDLMRFVDEHWQRGHVLATSRALMDWQHRGADGAYDYLLARDGDRLLGVLGYIASSRFDARPAAPEVVWLALWKIREDSAQPGLGLRMLRFLERAHDGAVLAVNGISLAHPPMYRGLGFEVVELAQHVLVNPDARQTLISGTPVQGSAPGGGGTAFTELRAADLDALPDRAFDAGALPAKTPTYFRERFLHHPFYRYRVFRLDSDHAGAGLLALRIAEHKGRRAVRIVDFAGNPALLGSCGLGIARFCAEFDAEYADFWSWGIDPALLAGSGFALVDPAGATTVPNYFEPFLARNGRILCAFRNPTGLRFRVFRADGDQDRPNRLEVAS